MKKILFVANIHKHFLAFHLPYIQWFKDKGYEVHVAAGGDRNIKVPVADKVYYLSLERSPFSINNIKACHELKSIIEQEKYCLLHCHTAMGAVISRIAGKEFRDKIGLKILYTAHGFHFYKNSPTRYWFMYYPMEYYLSKYTDAIITINAEDYNLVLNRKFKNKYTFKTHGVGINIDRLRVTSDPLRKELRSKYGYDNETVILIYVAEYIKRKNHEFIIRSIPQMVKSVPNLKVLFAGRGELMDKMKLLSEELNVDKYIDFLGFRKDIGELISLSDIGISSSKQEGLPMNIAEIMYSGLPVVASSDRGHRELIDHGFQGYIYEQGDMSSFVNYILKLANEKSIREKMGRSAHEHMKEFTLNETLKEMSKIYELFL